MLSNSRYWLITAFIILILSGCKKSGNNTPSSYMRFKLNGTDIVCDNNFYATPKLTSGPDANITFYARWGDKSVNFYLSTSSTNDITPGTYTFAPFKAYGVEIFPHTPFGNQYVAGSPSIGLATIAGSGQIVITEINANYIKGYFDFVTSLNSNTGLIMTVTNGEFNIKR